MTEQENTGWYGELVAAKYLELGTGRVCGYNLTNLKNGLSLVEPACVYAFSDIVIMRDTTDMEHILLYDVRTRRLSDDQYILVGKVFESLTIKKFSGTKSDISENFLVVKHSNHQITEMLKRRTYWTKSAPVVPQEYRKK